MTKSLLVYGYLFAAYFAQGTLLKAAPKVEATVLLHAVKGNVADFDVKLTNIGDESVFIEESRQGANNLHVASIDIETEPGRWVYAGPKMDAAASSVFELQPGSSVGRTVSLYGLNRSLLDLLSSPKAHYRVRLRYFDTRADWMEFARSVGGIHKPREVIGLNDPKETAVGTLLTH
jgi:hypothetical protein